MDPQKITYFGETDARGKKIKFGIKAKDRLRHLYVIGKTGMGKSTLLENMAIQDIQNGEGIAVIDPHGSMAEKILDYVPEHRVKDVLYFAPFDMEFPIAFNVMEDIGADKRHLVVNGLMSTFEKIWVDAWSARMAYILSNTLLALLEYPGSTLLGVNRMLSDKEYRRKVVENIKDTSVKAFWVDEFGKWTEKFIAEAIPAIQNKVGQFTSNPLVRNLLGQPQSSFDIRKMMDEKKILIVNLSKGRVGEGNANLIGSMLITKIYLAAMSRADASEVELNKLPNFYLYVDEFQSFANKSFADILSEARKYKLSLTIAHQYIEQMEEEVRDAVFGNVGTMVTFRVGAFDAEVLEKEFAPVFTAEDLVNLGFAQIYLKLMIDGVSSQPFSSTTLGPIARPEISFKKEVIDASHSQFARPRKEVEEMIAKFHEEGRPEGGGQHVQNMGQNRMSMGNGGQGGGGGGGRNDFRPNERRDDRGGYQGNHQGNQQGNQPGNQTGNQQSFPSNNQNQNRPVERRPDFSRTELRPEFVEVPSDETENIKAINSVPNPALPKDDANKLAFLKASEELKIKAETIERPKVETITQSNPVASQTSQTAPIIATATFANPAVIQNTQQNTEQNLHGEKLSIENLKTESRPSHEKAKVPTVENISSLKSALSAVLSKSIVPITNQPMTPPVTAHSTPIARAVEPVPIVLEPKAPEQKKEAELPPQKEIPVEQAKPKEYATVESSVREVPEDVLRSLLSMDK